VAPSRNSKSLQSRGKIVKDIIDKRYGRTFNFFSLFAGQFDELGYFSNYLLKFKRI
jgi:hypothetical protein